MRIKSFFSLFILTLPISILSAQEYANNLGFSVGVQQSEFDINIPIFLNKQFAIVPSTGLISISDKYTDITIGSSFRYYFNRKKLAPYSGIRLGTILYIPNNGVTVADYLGGLFIGTEYYIDSNLSVGGELQFNLSKSDKKSNRFGSPDSVIINTGSYLYLTFYFDE